jgi:probable HAF family extracellular repeat protein
MAASDLSGNVTESTVQFSTASASIHLSNVSNQPEVLPPDTAHSFGGGFRISAEASVPVAMLTVSLNGESEVTACAPCAVNTWYYFGLEGMQQGDNEIVVLAYDDNGEKIGVHRSLIIVSVPVRSYSLVAIGSSDWSDGHATALNESNQVVGEFQRQTERRAFVWDGNAIHDLGSTLEGNSRANGINEDGTVVGTFSSNCDQSYYLSRSFSFRIGVDNGPQPLLDQCGISAIDISDGGTILMWDRPASSAFLLNNDGRRPVRTGGTTISVPIRINNREDVLAQKTWPVLSADIYRTDAEPVEVSFCRAVDLNNRGNVAVESGCISAIFGQPGSVAGKSLVTIGARIVASNLRVSTNPSGMNDLDQAAGMYVWRTDRPSFAGLDRRPFFWDGEKMYDVVTDSSDWRVDGVVDINNAGVILAHAVNASTGRKSPVLLIPDD